MDLYSALGPSLLLQILGLLISPWALLLERLKVRTAGQLSVDNLSLGVPADHKNSNLPVPIYKVPDACFHIPHMHSKAVVLAAYCLHLA